MDVLHQLKLCPFCLALRLFPYIEHDCIGVIKSVVLHATANPAESTQSSVLPDYCSRNGLVVIQYTHTMLNTHTNKQ